MGVREQALQHARVRPKAPFAGPCSVLAVAGIRRLMVQNQGNQKDDLRDVAPKAAATCSKEREWGCAKKGSNTSACAAIGRNEKIPARVRFGLGFGVEIFGVAVSGFDGSGLHLAAGGGRNEKMPDDFVGELTF